MTNNEKETNSTTNSLPQLWQKIYLNYTKGDKPHGTRL